MEKTNIRYIMPQDIPDRIALSSIDVSFISLSRVLPAVHELLEVSRSADEETTAIPDDEETQATIARLLESMLDAAERLDFEKAAALRDQLLALKGEAPRADGEKSRRSRRKQRTKH